MRDALANPHEEFARSLLEHSMGAPFVFTPPDYAKQGGGSNEPPDLVWWCRDAAFFINMVNRPRKGHDKGETHNLKQLGGWLSAWHAGQPLVLENEFFSREVAADEIKNLTLVSVVAADDAVAWARPRGHRSRHETDERVSAHASLPPEVLLRLADLGGTARDLAEFLLALAQHEEPITAAEAVAMLNEQRESAVASARRRASGATFQPQIAETVVRAYLAAARPQMGIRNGKASMYEGLAVFNDLGWADITALMLVTAHSIEQVRAVPLGEAGPGGMLLGYKFDPYYFLVAVQAVDAATSITEHLAKEMARLRQERPDYPPVLSHFMVVGRPEIQLLTPMLATTPIHAPSVTGRLMAEMASAVEP